MEKLIVASNNAGKLNEIKALLSGIYDVKSLRDEGITIDVEETGETFEENALIKAKAVYEMTGCVSLSDDSGLEADGLNGAPGVYSARYAEGGHDDEKNNLLLLKNMQHVHNRKARFVCAVVLYKGEDDYLSARGETYGEISYRKIGENGFGYDPLFFSYELEKSFGMASAEEKNAVSHRAKALKNLLEKLSV